MEENDLQYILDALWPATVFSILYYANLKAQELIKEQNEEDDE